MVIEKITVSIYPDIAYGKPFHKFEVRVKNHKAEWVRTQLIEEDYLVSLFDTVFDGIKEQIRSDILGVKR